MIKWEKSPFRIKDLNDLFKSIDEFGGVWRSDICRFANHDWVMSQQMNHLLGRIGHKSLYFPQKVSETDDTKQKSRKKNMRITHVVIREFPTAIFFERWGSKKYCMEFTKAAAKPYLRVYQIVPVVTWDKHGKRKENK